MIKFQAIGNLGRDAETKRLDDGTNMIRFSIGVSIPAVGGQKKTQWISCAWYKQPQMSLAVVDYLKKGKTVYIEGTPNATVHEGVAYLGCRVSSVELLGGQQAAPAPAAAPAQPAQVQTEDDQLPF